MMSAEDDEIKPTPRGILIYTVLSLAVWVGIWKAAIHWGILG